jgi:hypothetical protein
MPVALLVLQAALQLVPEVAAAWPTIQALLANPSVAPTPSQSATLWSAVAAAHQRVQAA